MFTSKNLFFLLIWQVFFALLAIAIALVAIFFLSQAIEKTTTQVSEARRATSSLEKRTELFSKLRQDVEIVGTNNMLIEKAFLSSGNILEFTDAIDNLSLKNSFIPGAHFGIPQVTPIPAPFPLSVIAYDNSLVADMPKFIAYLKEFENLPYFTKIISLSFSSQNPEGWTKGGTASFHALFYTKNDL